MEDPNGSLLPSVISENENSQNDEQSKDSELPDDKMVEVRGRNKKLTILSFSLANFCFGAFFSLLGPFFPNEAKSKGVSSAMTGLIFGIYELVVVISSPIFGKYIRHIGAKFLFVTGVMVCGYCSILFGFLDKAPDGMIFVAMCFIVRFFESLGASAMVTASFAILAYQFPDNVATLFGTLELFGGLGMMTGPVLGGWLYELGGFKLPFLSSGAVLLLLGILFIFILPSAPGIGAPEKQSMLKMLKIPVISIMCVLLIVSAMTISYLDVVLSIVLNDRFQLSTLLIGLVFLAGSGTYGFMAPVWGFIGDKKPKSSPVLLGIGFVIGGFSFFLMGPAPFMNLGNHLWITVISMVLMGLGIGSVILAFQVINDAAKANGFPDSLETYGLVSGIFNSFFSFGAFIGPIGGGYINEIIGFEWTCVLMGGLAIASGLLMLAYQVTISGCTNKAGVQEESTEDETRPLLS